MFNKIRKGRTNSFLDIIGNVFKVFCLIVCILFVGCNEKDIRDDITKLLGFIDGQNYEGYKKRLNGEIFNLKNENQWLTADIFFENSKEYQNSICFILDSLMNANRFEQALQIIDKHYKQVESDNMPILTYYLVFVKCQIMLKLNRYDQFRKLENQSGIMTPRGDHRFIRLYFYLKYNVSRVYHFTKSGLYDEAIGFAELGLFLLKTNNLENEWSNLYVSYCFEASRALRQNNAKLCIWRKLLKLKKEKSIVWSYLISQLI